MHPPPVQSFGRRTGPEEQVAGPVILPAVQMPPVQLPIVLVVDVESLAVAAEQITEMVTRAVRAGFVRAVEDIEASAEPVDLDEPEPNLDQLGHLAR